MTDNKGGRTFAKKPLKAQHQKAVPHGPLPIGLLPVPTSVLPGDLPLVRRLDEHGVSTSPTGFNTLGASL
jgi:hypothetical protein